MKKILFMGLLVLSSAILSGCSVMDVVGNIFEQNKENNEKMDEVIWDITIDEE